MKSLDQFRAGRNEVYNRLFSARSLCAAGLLAAPAILFNPSTPLRAAQFLFFWFLCWLAGKKNNPLMTLLVILGIIVISLLVPYGRVLFSIGIFRVSSGALMMGVRRAVTLEGLIMLSRLFIRQDLKLPGGFGSLISESFRFLAIIIDSGKRITKNNFINDIDNLMLELSGREGESDDKTSLRQTPRTKPAGFVILPAAVILSWLFFAVHFIIR